jgi:hypothetical protein
LNAEDQKELLKEWSLAAEEQLKNKKTIKK